MLAVLYLLLTGVLAFFLQTRVALLDGFRGLSRYLCSLGLTLFLVTWMDFLLFALVGWSPAYAWLSWCVLFVPLFYFSGIWKPRPAGGAGWRSSLALPELRPFLPLNYWFLFLAGFVLIRYYVGIDADEVGNIWSTFNFVDTAFHLSVVNAFLAAPGFPPMDLDMAPYPLKYHFLADFHVAHLTRLGVPALTALWWMNLVSATVMVGALWATFKRWLQLPARWVMLAGLIFLFLNTALLNLIHYLVLRPKFFDAQNTFYGLVQFPYFNFESTQANLLEPQRSLLFSLPIVLLVLNAAFGEPEPARSEPPARIRTLQTFVLVCLLPLSHIVAFAVLAPALIPQLWRHRTWVLSCYLVWAPAFALGILQLSYLRFYGPPTNPNFSAWSVASVIPLQDFAALPECTRRIAFWFFANGDFFSWSLLFVLLALARRNRASAEPGQAPALWPFLVRWRWYFAVCGAFFALINVFRYSFDWGDSNKFVVFFNLGLTLVIVLGAAQWIGRRARFVSHALWGFFLLLSIGPPIYGFYDNVIASAHGRGTVLLFEENGRRAAAWAKVALRPTDLILTAAYPTFHFVTPLAGQPTLAGIYGDSNPYRQDNRAAAIRRIYEQGDVQKLREFNIRYVCISRNERTKYKLDPKWIRLMKSGRGVAFSSGGGPADYHSVYIFDCTRLALQ